MARHDARRVGVSTKGSNIKKPAAYWRARLGGAPTIGQAYVGDLNKDGKEDLLFVSGGELILASPNGDVLWRTGARDFDEVVAIADFDQDGTPELVASTPTGCSLIAATSGKVHWSLAPGEIGTPGAFRVGDLNGDGKPELWIDTCGCCAIEKGSPGVVLSFAAGLDAPTTLGAPPARTHCGAQSNTLGDFDGDGKLDMIVMSEDDATLFGADGKAVATSQPLPKHVGSAQCQAAQLDDTPREELICFTNWVHSGAGQRGLFALRLDPAQTPGLRLLWDSVVSAADGGDARAPTRLSVDLDGDGKLEAVVSGEVNGQYKTFVLNAQTGAELATFAGSAEGDIPDPSQGKRLLLVTTATGTVALSFASSPPGLNPVWSVSGYRVTKGRDWTLASRSGLAETLVADDLTGDTYPEIVLGSMVEPAAVVAYDAAGGTPLLVGKYTLDGGVEASAVGLRGSGATSRFLVGRTDGYVVLLDGALKPTNPSSDGVSALPGTYVGGYYTGRGAGQGLWRGPIAGKSAATDAAEMLLVVDSRGDLVRLDTTGASNVAPAKPQWRLRDTFGASMSTPNAGSTVIGGFRRLHPLTNPPDYVMSTITPTGQVTHSLKLPRKPQWDIVPGDFVGDGTTSFVALTADASLKTDLTCMGATGSLVWQKSVENVSGTEPFSAGDWDGDGADDVVTFISVARVHRGKTGAEVAAAAQTLYYYFTPILQDLTGDASYEIVAQGGYLPVRGLSHDLKTLWIASGPAQPMPYGSLVTCATGAVLVGGSLSSPAQLTFTRASGSAAGTFTAVVLGSGSAFESVAAAQAKNAVLGQLSDIAASTDLDGSGQGPTAVVGSTDGYLYAVDPCTASLRWSHSFGRPVGSPILADTDGDGADEILASVADGYLYALKNESLPAPAFVWDVDPPGTVDVDEIVTEGSLHATWAPVSGATGYEVAVTGATGAYITTPSWVAVGAVTSASLAGLKLYDGAKYYVGVRAISADGKSADTASDGVLVHAPQSDAGVNDGAAGAAGTAGTGGTSSTGGASGFGGGAGAGNSGPGGTGGAVPPGEILSGRACTCSAVGAQGSSSAAWPLALVWLGAWTRVLRRRGTLLPRRPGRQD